MARDDYFVLAYQILAYLYKCLKMGEPLSLAYLCHDTESFPVGQSYWEYILFHLYEDGLLEGVVLIPILGDLQPSVKLTAGTRITPKGIAYLQENSAMSRARQFLKELKEIVPGL